MKLNRLTLMSMLIALAVVGRISFTFIPNVQPTTVIIIVSSFILSPVEAVIVATLSAVVSNMFLGFGVWTIWQAVTWSVIGLISGLIGKVHHKIPLPILAIYGGFCGLLYGFLISLMSSTVFENFWGYYLAGLPFDISHAVGNTLFLFMFYPVFFKVYKKFKK